MREFWVWYIICTFAHPVTGEEWASASWVVVFDRVEVPPLNALQSQVNRMTKEIKEKLGDDFDMSILNWTGYGDFDPREEEE